MGGFTSTKLAAALQVIGMATLLAAIPTVHAADAPSPAEAEAPGTRVTWNNTVRYGAAFRTRSQNPALLGNVNADDGDRNFKRGLISNRVELLSELDASVANGLGLRLSALGWYDAVYNQRNDNPGFAGGAVPNQVSVAPDRFTATTRRLHGRDVQLRDAFVSYKFDANGMPTALRLGQHALVWGESVFFAGNAIAGAQSSFDIARLLADPTAQAKEFVLPVPQVSGQIQITPATTLSAYYQFRWRKHQIPAVGSYFSNLDFVGSGAESVWVGPGAAVPVLGDMEPKNGGQGGIQIRTNAFETDFGLYALRFHDKTPQIVTNVGLGPAGPRPTGVYQAYPEGIKVFGASASRTFGDANIAIEASVRHNQPLASSGGTVDPSALLSALMGVPVPANDNRGNPAYAVGKTAHLNLSTLWTVPSTPLWREAVFLGEIAWNRMLSCTRNCVAPAPGAAPALDPNGTRDAVALRFVLTPTYRQLVTGWDVSVPFGIGWSPSGSRSLATGPGGFPPENGGDITIGLNGVYQNAWNVSLAYTHFFGRADTLISSNPALAAAAPFTYGQTLKDRDFVAFTVRRSF
jgi:uncharacterized protein DUF1302